ncbi:phosphotransferase family protein [Phytoactinopolyspora limicola]|uniref:phosphotransferase family protein n=1 Tax=Phytoactinopolyspora limicola TaxID=2715536 RepID=UPI0014078AC8|nr:phosphotransferase [Phytoactinopolyspora limicola]
MDENKAAVPQLRHGYTNATRRTRQYVEKKYLGPDADKRRHAEYVALTRLRSHLPVPDVLAGPDGGLRIGYVAGVHGQELLISADPRQVLGACGSVLARLHALDPAALGYPAGEPGQCVVHGDFGPQNMLLDPTGTVVAAVIDWEFSRVGDPVDDVSMAEWIVRTHHPDLAGQFDAFFAGYGATPEWPLRHAAMVAMCRRMRLFCEQWGADAGVAQWDRRLVATEQFIE